MDFWDIMLEAEEASEYETLYMATLLGTSTNSKSPSPFIPCTLLLTMLLQH